MSNSPTNRLAHDLDNILGRTEPLWQELRGQRILITGATGFVGCWLLEDVQSVGGGRGEFRDAIRVQFERG